MTPSPRLLAVPVSVLVVRAALLLLTPSVVAPALLLVLDLAALLVLTLAAIFGRIVGSMLGSTVISFVCVGLPVAGLGALTEALVNREASNLAGMLALLGVGVGLCLAFPAREDRFGQALVLVLGVAALALGSKLMVNSFGVAAGAPLAAPYAMAAILALGLRPLAPSSSDAA